MISKTFIALLTLFGIHVFETGPLWARLTLAGASVVIVVGTMYLACRAAGNYSFFRNAVLALIGVFAITGVLIAMR